MNFSTPVKISCILAISASFIIIPIELIRRWHQLTDLHYFFAWFDDMIACGFLLFSVWKMYRSQNGQRFLTAAWGFAAGMMYSSFFIQYANQHLPDPSGIPVAKVLIFKFCIFIITITGLILSMLPSPETNRDKSTLRRN